MKNINNAKTMNEKELENVVGGITQNEAMYAAMNHAGVNGAQTMMTKCELDYDWGTQVYEIEFYFNGIEYEYEIDANTGAVLKAKKDWD